MVGCGELGLVLPVMHLRLGGVLGMWSVVLAAVESWLVWMVGWCGRSGGLHQLDVVGAWDGGGLHQDDVAGERGCSLHLPLPWNLQGPEGVVMSR